MLKETAIDVLRKIIRDIEAEKYGNNPTLALSICGEEDETQFTVASNADDMVAISLFGIGVNHVAAKLEEEQVQACYLGGVDLSDQLVN